MNKNKSVNQQCLEKILCHLTKLVCLTEFDNIKDLDKLVNMATSVSAQLLATEINNVEECVYDEEDTECEEEYSEDYE